MAQEHVIDCAGKVLGRVASHVALILQGKNRADYTPNKAGEDSVRIKNISKLCVTGSKADQKMYYAHTTQIGHLKEKKFKDVVAKHGNGYVLRRAVLHMLPKNRLQAVRIKRLIIEKEL